MSQPSTLKATRPTLAVLVHAGFPTDCLIDVRELCKSFAGFVGEPVALGISDKNELYETLGGLPGEADAWKVEFVAPQAMAAAAMSSADFIFKDDGRPDWSAMWTGFCELALYGGPPHRGEANALVEASPDAAATPDFNAIAEIRRGIFETTGLFSERAEPGWLAITCGSRKMAAWLAATIILENVEARFDEERLLVPAHESFTLKNEVKSVITVVAKCHHYWQAHIAGGQAP
jgi:sirohydrochlorin cobaltochelatase